MNISFKAFLFFITIFISLDFLSAQTLNLQNIPSDKMQFGFSFSKPFYSDDFDVSTLSGAFELSGNIPVSSRLNIIGNFPFINTSYDFGNYKYERSGIGNIFIGIQTNPNTIDNGKSIFIFGLFLPTADEQAAFSGLDINFYDIQKYIPNSVGLYFNYAYHKIINEGLNYGFEAGPNLLIPTEGENSETELFLHYGIHTGYQVNKLLLNVEFLGIAIISQDIDNFGDRLVHQLGFGAQWKEALITPKIFYRIYLREEMREIIDGVLGIGVSISIN
jgi:hypothetical protein